MCKNIEIAVHIKYTEDMKRYFYVKSGEKSDMKSEWTDRLTLAQAADAAGETGAMCALVDGKLEALGARVPPGACVQFLKPQQSEHASRVFLRGVTFLLHCAVQALFPQTPLLVDHVLGGGVFCRMDGMTKDDISALEKKIHSYIDADKPFVHKHVDVEKAHDTLAEQGRHELVRLLKFRPFDYFELYEFDGRQNYFHGIMPPSAGCLKGATLRAYPGGFILRYPAPYRTPGPDIAHQSKFAAVFAQAELWAQEMSAAYIADINECYLRGEIEDLIAVNEALHEKRIADIAQMIAQSPGVRVVLIAGPSSSGKTSFAKRLAVHLRVLGYQCMPISIDDYYKNRDSIARDANGDLDLENLEALDVRKLGEDLEALLGGQTAYLPEFDFVAGKRKHETRPLRIDDELLLIEGIHGLNDELTRGIADDKKFKIFISPLTALNFDTLSTVLPEDLRLLRRLARDKRTRGASFAETFELWESVRSGEYKYIFPYQETADVMFNSTLIYEPLVLKKYCYDDLRTIEAHEESYPQAQSLLKFLNYFLSMNDERAIPVNSILREFIGE